MKTEIFEFAGYNGIFLPAYLWLPDGDVKAIWNRPSARMAAVHHDGDREWADQKGWL